MAQVDGAMAENEGKELFFFWGVGGREIGGSSRCRALDAVSVKSNYGRERIVLKRGKLIRATNNRMTVVLTCGCFRHWKDLTKLWVPLSVTIGSRFCHSVMLTFTTQTLRNSAV